MNRKNLKKLVPLVALASALLLYTIMTQPTARLEWSYALFSALIVLLSGRRITLPTGEHLNPAVPVAAAAAVVIPGALGAMVIGGSILVSSAIIYLSSSINRELTLFASPFQAIIATLGAAYVANSLTTVDYASNSGYGLLSWEFLVLMLAVGLYQLIDVILDEIGLSMSTLDVRLSPRQAAETIMDLFPPHFSLVCLSALSVVMYSALGYWVLILTSFIVLAIGVSVNQYSRAVRDRSNTLASLAAATLGGPGHASMLQIAVNEARSMSRAAGLTRRDSITVTEALLIHLVSTISRDGDPVDHTDKYGGHYESGVGVVFSLSNTDELRLVTLMASSDRPNPSASARSKAMADIVRQVAQGILSQPLAAAVPSAARG